MRYYFNAKKSFPTIAFVLGAFFAFTLFSARGEAGTLPQVLILGDSISIGYTPYVQQYLAGIADVKRPSENCMYSGYGLSQLNTWLGASKWDVIHFNWGIWDTHMILNGQIVSMANEHPVVADDTYGYVSDNGAKIRTSPSTYRSNLSQIVDGLKQTGARLIFATTTPIVSRRPENQFLIEEYNDIAVTLMNERGVAIDDLSQLVHTSGSEWFQADGVHYTDAGYQQLAVQVSSSIVPEPKALLLLATGAINLLLISAWRKRRRIKWTSIRQ